MQLPAMILVLVAAFLHASWNIVAKRHGGGRHFAFTGAVAMTVVWAPLGLWLTWEAAPHFGLRAWAALLASGVLHLAYFNVLLAGYRAADLTVVYPVARGSGPLLAAFVAVGLFDEQLGFVGVGGVLTISLGVLLIAGGPALWRGGDDERRRRRLRGVAWGAATGLLIASYSLVDGYSVKRLLISPIVVDWMSNALRSACMVPGAVLDWPGLKHELRTGWKAALLLGLVSPLGYVLVLYAVAMAPLSRVAPARELSMLFAALLGKRLLGEAERGVRLLGAGCIAAGVMALSWG